jgi:hypothetical protein
MKRKTKILGIGAGCLGLSVLAAVAVLGVGIFAFFFVFGTPYSNTPRDRAKLRAIRDPFAKVPAAIEAQKKARGAYPRDVADFDPAIPGGADAMRILRDTKLHYSSGDPTRYSIYIKLNWDGGLSYGSDDPRWVYGANDDPGWPID